MFFLLWLRRFFLSRHKFIRFTPLVSIISLTLASSSLILAMSVYSGYESTVRQSIVDISGHLVVTGRKLTKEKVLLNKINESSDNISSVSPFLSLKSLLVYEGKLSGVLLEGISNKQGPHHMGLKKRLIAGSLSLKDQKAAVIGRGIAKQFKLKPGDTFHIVIPKVDSKGGFQNTHQDFYVEGVLDLGFHDFNSRHILVNIQMARKLIKEPGIVSGVRMMVKDLRGIENIKSEIAINLGRSYFVRDWQGVINTIHESYFEAVRREKFLIFFILMVLVLAGSFNVSSHLSISVLNQIREISILKVMGASKKFIFSLLLMQGFLVSFFGTLIGMGLGWLFSKGFVTVQSIWEMIPSEIYKINTIVTDIKISDVILIFVCSQFICLVSCILPAWRALRLSLREGVLYE